jgi:superfamily I DNA and RNA helicase
MPLDVLITTDRISHDPEGREFVELIQREAQQFGLDDAALYYDFPTYSDYETVSHKPDALIVSRSHGVVAIRFVNGADAGQASSAMLATLDESLGQFCSILIGRLLKSRTLRSGLSALLFPITPVVFVAQAAGPALELDNSKFVASVSGFRTLLASLRNRPFSAEAMAEIRSVVEGAKALARPQKRFIEDPKTQRLAAALSSLEATIANFDQKQRRAALVTVTGPQRIRGLAGSGKTVILAMKAAHLHLTRPDERILVAFWTRSLRATIKVLITRFFRHYRDEDPDWDMIHIRHGWGGASSEGVYADACRRHGLAPLSFGAARQGAVGRTDPFDFACRSLLTSRSRIEAFYDHVLIDEGQDLPGGFYELCFELAKGARDEKSIVWAYDELQNILNIRLPSPEQLFGQDADGEPKVSLERTARSFPPGATNDTVLSKCYRNQRDVLVVAHAIGFGIYREIVQLLESREHWQDVGYEVEGDYGIGKSVRILRPAENSPAILDARQGGKIIDKYVAENLAAEVSWVAEGIKEFLTGGLQPEDIVIIALDDRNVRTYFSAVSAELAGRGIATNNIIADPYNEPAFMLPGKVTLSTVYRAKGNEAAVVFALGIDAIAPRVRSGRNKLFTAFTRTKAWLRISGVGDAAKDFCQEIDRALSKLPYLQFLVPDLERIELIQRDLSERNARARRIRDEYIRKLKSEGFGEEEIADILSEDFRNG